MFAILTNSGLPSPRNSKGGPARSAGLDNARGRRLGRHGSAVAARRTSGSHLAIIGLAIIALALSCALAPAAFAAWHIIQPVCAFDAEGDMVALFNEGQVPPFVRNDGQLDGLAVLQRHAYHCLISTRRLRWRPSGVSLEATGRE